MALSPAMKKYLELKEQYPDCVLFYRLGDFYEMFFDDAKNVSAAIGLTLTGKSCGLEEKAPMCGVPYHAANIYIKKLVELGFKIAIAEQLEASNGRTLINRDVVRVITSGTVIDDAMLADDKNNFVAAIYENGEGMVYASWADITTGELYAGQFDNYENAISQIRPKETITKKHYEYAFTTKHANETVKKYFNINSTDVFDISEKSPLINAVGGLLEYLLMTQKNKLSNITKVSLIKNKDFMLIDKTARETLEIVASYRDNLKAGSLLSVLDKTKTPMGARLMASWVTSPLCNKKEIEKRQNAIQEMVDNPSLSDEIREVLKGFNDISRFSGKVANGNINPRDLVAFCNNLDLIEKIKNMLLTSIKNELAQKTANTLNPLLELKKYLRNAIKAEPSAVLNDGGYVNDGFNEKLDELRNIGTLGKEWLLKLEQKERKATGIDKLKISYNRVTGWYLEVPISLAGSMPYSYIRKGSTMNTERFTTDELREIESKIMNASGESIKIEQQIFADCLTLVKKEMQSIKLNSEGVALIDVISTLSVIAFKEEWIKPKLTQGKELLLKDARHPVVEKIVSRSQFVANDCDLDSSNTTMLITGPNMAGKSTFMKTVALNVILAHIGSFVPCSSAVVPMMDRIFTRIGASDDMLTGKSTFMVEMNEISNIIHNATSNSLLLIDEIGRGTGTKDGFALAKAILQYIVQKIGSKTLFATHFHNLSEITKEYDQIQNYKVLTSNINGQIIFLHKVVKGQEQNSFGAEVARLSGIPNEIIEKAKSIMQEEDVV